MGTVYRIVLTGGPCGGKSTALAKLHERMTSLGFRVFLVPEVPTLLLSGGVSFAGATSEHIHVIELGMLNAQLALEDSFVRIAEHTGSNCVVICDRGAMDIAAYLPQTAWQALLDERGTTAVALRDRRYDAVLHMVTAAEGAEAFYTTANNTARTETPEQARAIDHRLREVWLGHPHLRVIDNSTDFNRKVQRVLSAICSVTGVPEPVETERKYLVKSVPDPLPVRHETVDIEQTYLVTPAGSESRVRRRGQHGSYAYTHTVKRPLREGQRIEAERPISAREYVALLGQRDGTRKTIQKRRSCFLWEGHYFELDRFIDPHPGLLVLELELDEGTKPPPLPPWIEVVRDVTNEPQYSNFAIASGE